MQLLIIEDEARAASQLQRMLKSCNFDWGSICSLKRPEIKSSSSTLGWPGAPTIA